MFLTTSFSVGFYLRNVVWCINMAAFSTAVFLTVVAILLIYVLILLFRRLRFVATINKIPGHPSSHFPILGDSIRVFSDRKNVLTAVYNAISPFASRYPISRLWLGPVPLVVILNSEAAKVVLNSNKHIEKSRYYNYLHNWIGTGLLTSKGSKWQHRRKLITPSFHFRILDGFLLTMNEQANILMDILTKKCHQTNGHKFDIYPYITRCTLDIICETAMGQGVNAQVNTDSEYVNAICDIGHTIFTRTLRPWLDPEWTYGLSDLGKLEKRSLKIIHEFTNRIIKIKRAKLNESSGQNKTVENDDVGIKRRLALLDMLLEQSTADSDGPQLTDEDIREEVDTFMFEGHDTTSVGLSWSLYCIGSYPEIQQKIVDELNEVFGDSNLDATSADLNKLKYLECVIKESHRLYPPVPMIGRVVREETEICGYKIPANTQLAIFPFIIHRDETQYPNFEKFDPERFSNEVSQSRDPFAYVPFSAGPRNCIGQKFAYMEEKVVLSRILRKFKINSISKKNMNKNIGKMTTEKFLPKATLELVLRPVDGVYLKFEPRQ